jgi:hypothetical protein
MRCFPAEGSRSAPASAQSGFMPSQGYITCLFRCVPVLQQGRDVKYASFSKDPINPISGHTLDTRHPDGHGALNQEPQLSQSLACHGVKVDPRNYICSLQSARTYRSRVMNEHIWSIAIPSRNRVYAEDEHALRHVD